MHTIDVFTHFMPPRFLQKFQAWAPDEGMFRRSMQAKPLFEIDARDHQQFAPLFEWVHGANVPLFLYPARSERFADYSTDKQSIFEIWWTLGWKRHA